jgi:nucleoid-associated protein YgaU
MKLENEAYINELYASFPHFTFEEKKDASEIIEALREINLEYEKYIAVYNYKNQKEKVKNQYIVIDGDTLPKIAHKTTNDWRNWEAIYLHNSLEDLILSPGLVLEVPDNL